MANSKYSDAAYTNLISTAIGDFDKVFAALKKKGVKYNGSELSSDTTGVPTAQYGNLIGYLTKIGENGRSDLDAVSDWSGEAKSDGVLTVSGNQGTIKIGSAGYYDTSSTLTFEISASTLSISGDISGKAVTPEEGSAYYQFDSEDGKFYSTIKLAQADLNVSLSADDTVSKVKNDVTTTLEATTLKIVSSVTEAEASNYLTFNIKSVSDVSGKVTATPTATLTAQGYLNAAPTIEALDIDIGSQDGDNTETFYIKKSTVGEVSGSTAIVVDGTPGVILVDDKSATAENSYDITLKAEDADVSVTVTEGYISEADGKITGKATVEGKTVHVKKGTLSATTDGAKVIPTYTDASSVVAGTTAADDYVITLNADTSALTGDALYTVEPGYISSSAVANPVVGSESVDVHIAKASVSAEIDPTLELSSATSGIISTSAPTEGGYYTIKANVSGDIVAAVSKVGYIKSATEIALTSLNKDSTDYYIKKGKVSHTSTLGVGNTDFKLSLSQTKPASGKYVELVNTCTPSFTEGYITATEVDNKNLEEKYYIPEATFEYVEGSTGDRFIQVSSAGYIAAGAFAVTEGTIDNANLVLNFTGSDGASSLFTTGDGYSFSIAVDASSDFGYFDASGNSTLKYTAKIAKGSVGITTDKVTTVTGSTTPTKKTGTTTTYDFDLSADTTIELSHTAGYIAAADFPANKDISGTGTLSLSQAEISLAAKQVNLETTATGLETVDSSAYYVTPSLAAGQTVQATVSKAGYVDTSVTSAAAALTDGTAEKTYIKAGTTKTLANATAYTPTISGAVYDSSTKKYTVSVSGNTSYAASLDTGYYGATEKDITVTGSISGSKAYDAAKVVNNIAATSVLIPSGITIVEDEALRDTENFDYASFTADINSVTLTHSGSTSGFFSNQSGEIVDNTSSISKAAVTYYVKKYGKGLTPSTSTVENHTTETVYKPIANGIEEDTVIDVAEQYSEYGIEVKIGANAMGSNVQADLEKLRKRLAGELATTL